MLPKLKSSKYILVYRSSLGTLYTHVYLLQAQLVGEELVFTGTILQVLTLPSHILLLASYFG
jgi:hypothetical protein